MGQQVKLSGWMENVREVGQNFAFVILRDFYGTTQVVIETEEMMNIVHGLNKESTISVEGTVRERSSKNKNLPTGEIEVVPEKIEVLGKCQYNELRFLLFRIDIGVCFQDISQHILQPLLLVCRTDGPGVSHKLHVQISIEVIEVQQISGSCVIRKRNHHDTEPYPYLQ